MFIGIEMEYWTLPETLKWLQLKGYSEFESHFRLYNIDGEGLIELGAQYFMNSLSNESRTKEHLMTDVIKFSSKFEEMKQNSLENRYLANRQQFEAHVIPTDPIELVKYYHQQT